MEESRGKPSMNSKPEFHVIVSSMRSGSTLFGNLLAEAGWVRFAGETHENLSDEDGVRRSRSKILSLGGSFLDVSGVNPHLAEIWFPGRSGFTLAGWPRNPYPSRGASPT